MNKKTTHAWAAAIAACALLAGCAAGPAGMTLAQLNELTQRTVTESFRDEGQAKVTRITQTDETNRVCSLADAEGVSLDEKTAQAIEAANFKAIAWPANRADLGQFIGDWREGEKVAQSGRGLTWSDAPNTVNGGNCYNCHQMDKKEISFGTIGPSLYNFGKLRGVVNPTDPASRAMVEYTWGKIWNAKAYNACSNMPRAGRMGILTQAQVRDLVALLLDPQSHVNQ